MRLSARHLAQAAILAALYAILTYYQNILLPGSASWAVQLRLSEALCILAFFTPAAPLGLSMGCLLFNLSFSAALPLDFLVGPLATWLSARAMWRTRGITVLGIPLLGLTMPALWNALLVGAELTLYTGGGFFLNAAYIALGEGLVLFLPGLLLYKAIQNRRLAQRLFS